MANFRQNHNRNSKNSASTMFRLVVFFGVVLVTLFLLYSKFNTSNEAFPKKSSVNINTKDENNGLYYLPKGGKGEIVEHNAYALSYVERYEQAEWVAYELTKAQLQLPNNPRKDWFEEDPQVSTKSAKHGDYIRSGYSRGHLIPAADRSYDKELLQETFFMSNISPQLSVFNGGVWNELENIVRDWAYDFDRILVVTGPVLDNSIDEYIGGNRVGVPKEFYKVILDIGSEPIKGIGFILPNKVSYERLETYASSIDEVENITGLDFFADFLEDGLENTIESKFDIREWPFNEKLYNTRINNWNNR